MMDINQRNPRRKPWALSRKQTARISPRFRRCYGIIMEGVYVAWRNFQRVQREDHQCYSGQPGGELHGRKGICLPPQLESLGQPPQCSCEGGHKMEAWTPSSLQSILFISLILSSEIINCHQLSLNLWMVLTVNHLSEKKVEWGEGKITPIALKPELIF